MKNLIMWRGYARAFFLLSVILFPLLGLAQLSPNEVSHLLAGSAAAENPSPLYLRITHSKEWQSRLNSSLKYRFSPPTNFPAQTRVTKEDREALKDFAAQNLTAAYTRTKTLFYPFGGPDAFYPFVFFPNTQRVIVAALEAPGQLLQIKDESNLGALYRGMDSLSTAYRSYFNYGYFITSEMGNQISASVGTSMVICASLAAQGFQVLSATSVAVNKEGALVASKESGNGVEIKFIKNDKNRTPASFVYFKQNLANNGIGPAFENFIISEKADSTYFKAASYVPHDTANFSKINNLALRSRYIVQGDSGLPWELIKNNSNVLHIDLFGQYTRPSAQFGISYQTSLMKSIGASIQRSKLEIAREGAEDFKRFEGQDPARQSTSSDESYVDWKGYLPIRYDYAGVLNSYNSGEKMKNKYSILIYATLNH